MAGGVGCAEGNDGETPKMNRRVVVSEGNGSRKRPFVIVDEPLKAEPDASFDVAQCGSLIHYRTVKAEDDVVMNGPEGPVVITVPNEEILKLVCQQMRLQIHKKSVFSEDGGMVRGLIRMDVPDPTPRGRLKTKNFVGDEANASSHALDSAAKSALLFLVNHCDIIIKDLNSAAAREAERKEAISRDYEELLSDMVTARETNLSQVYDSFKDLFEEGKVICMKFGDILPVTLSHSMDPLPSSGEQKLLYTGSRPPATRLDLFTLTMVEFMNKGASLDRIDPALF